MTQKKDAALRAKKRKDVKWLCRCSLNWNDEVDFTLYQLMTDEEKKTVQNRLKRGGNEYFTAFFGAAQEQNYTGAELRDALTWYKIQDEKILQFLRRTVGEDQDFVSAMVLENYGWRGDPGEE